MVADELAEAKRTLRRQMRAVRRGIADVDDRSARIVSQLERLAPVATASVVMAFNAVPGEPDVSAFVRWCEASGKTVVLPEPDRQAIAPVAPELVDLVIVPGLAFTRLGDRLGQGGGWYDRFLAGVRPGCVTVGVCFEPQLLEEIPTGVHDVRLDLVVTDARFPELAETNHDRRSI